MKKLLFAVIVLLTMGGAKAEAYNDTVTPDVTVDMEGVLITIVADGIIASRITRQQVADKSSGTYLANNSRFLMRK